MVVVIWTGGKRRGRFPSLTGVTRGESLGRVGRKRVEEGGGGGSGCM